MSNKTLHPATIPTTFKPLPVVDCHDLADWLIQLATDQIEDQFGNPVDVSEILALYGGAVEADVYVRHIFDLFDGFTESKVRDTFMLDADRGERIGTSVERTLAGWVPSADLNNPHNLEAFEQAFDNGETDWSGRNSDGHPVDCDGIYDADNSGFFDKFGTPDTLGFSEIVEPEQPESGWFDPNHIETLWDLEEVPTI
jgi:hypothetical protein